MKNIILISFVLFLTSTSLQAQYNQSESNTEFSFKLIGGLDMQSMDVQFPMSGNINEFGSQLSFNGGIEMEYIFDFNSKKHRIVLGLQSQYYKDGNTVTVDYKAINIPFGYRNYIKVSENAYFFWNVFYRFFIIVKKPVISNQYGDEFDEAKPRSNLSFGLGYEHKKLSFEFRYRLKSNLLAEYQGFNADLNSLSLILGYRITK